MKRHQSQIFLYCLILTCLQANVLHSFQDHNLASDEAGHVLHTAIPYEKQQHAASILQSWISTPSPVTALAISPSGRFAVAGSQSGPVVYSQPDLEMVARLPTEIQAIHDVQFTANGRFLVVAGGSPGQVGQVELLSWTETALGPVVSVAGRISSHSDVVYSIAWHAVDPQISTSEKEDGNHHVSNQKLLLATASLDGIGLLFDISKLPDVSSGTDLLRPILRFEGHSRGLTGVAFVQSSAQLLLVTSSMDQTLGVWSASEGKLMRTFNNHTNSVTGISLRPGKFSASMPMLASIADDRTVRFWQPTIGRMVSFRRFESTPTSLAWSQDGNQLVVGCHDGTIHWIIPSPLAVQASMHSAPSRIHAMAVEPSNHAVLAGSRAGLGLLRK